MKVNMTIEVRIFQQGSYGNAFTLGDTYQLDLSRLSEMAEVLVKLHEACEAVAKQSGAQPHKG